MRIVRVPLILAVTTVFAWSAAHAQSAYEEQFVREAEILERDLDNYAAARARESEAVREVRDLNTQLDALLADPHAPVSSMRQLEVRIASATDRAYRSLQETARARAPIYDQMDRLAGLAGQIKERPPAPIDDDNPRGLWEFRLDPVGIHALVELEFQIGGLNSSYTAVGTYRTSNGRRGTLRGTYAGNRVDLEALDSRDGKVADLSGTVGHQGTVQGTWSAVRTGLRRDQTGGGTWTGHRVSSAAEVSLD